MRYRAILFQGADEVWSTSGDGLLGVLIESNRAIATFRQRGRPVDGGEVWADEALKHTLKDEHWVTPQPKSAAGAS